VQQKQLNRRLPHNGAELLVEGFLRFEESGTNTLKPIYADVNLTIARTNPVKLDGAGRVPSLFLQGTYKVTAFKNDGVDGLGEQQWERDPVGGEAGEFGGDWDSITQYNLADIVRGSDDKYYQSITTNNTGNDPISTPSAWSELNWFTVWNTSQTYSQVDNVKGSDGVIYYSVLGSNQGNDPTTDDGTNWLAAASVSTDTLKGLALKSTQAKTDAGTDDDVYITAKQLQDITATIPGLTAGGTETPAAFRGALVQKLAGQSVAGTTFLQFDTEIYDTDSIHDNVTNNTRLTVPSGASRVKLSAQLGSGTVITSSPSISFIKNGATPDVGVINKVQYSSDNPLMQCISPVFSVIPGDYFEVSISGATLTTSIGNTWFAMEIIE
jgi:hypothetical protein